MYGQNQRLVVVRKKREQCLILTFTHSKPVFQAVLLQPTLLVGARSRGKIPESRFWQRLPLNLQRIKFVFFSFSFFFKNIFIPFCHRISWTMFIFPFQVTVYGFFHSQMGGTDTFLSFSFFPYEILSTCRWSRSVRLYFRGLIVLHYHYITSENE